MAQSRANRFESLSKMAQLSSCTLSKTPRSCGQAKWGHGPESAPGPNRRRKKRPNTSGLATTLAPYTGVNIFHKVFISQEGTGSDGFPKGPSRLLGL